MFNIIEKPILKWLTQMGLSSSSANSIYYAIITIVLIALSIVILLICKKVFKNLGYKISQKSETFFDDELYNNHFFTKLSLLIPLLFFDKCFGTFLAHYNLPTTFINTITSILYVIFFIILSFTLLSAVNFVYDNKNKASGRSIKNIIQALKTILGIVAAIIIISLIFNESTKTILTAFGALSAVLMLVFKDTILGFVGGIQLAFNKIVLIGDWIEMPEYGADGNVVEISLITVKVQNWDKTITTIPTYNLITNGVKNWRVASNSNTRRIVRSVYIDASTVKFCDDELFQRLEKVDSIKEYLKKRNSEIEAFNKANDIDESIEINGRRQTNLGIFRAYLYHYLQNNVNIDKNSTLLVRQRQSNNFGIPLEIYVFTNTSEWIPYENIQSDIFDHIFASIDFFDLKVFQSPAGNDFAAIKERDAM